MGTQTSKPNHLNTILLVFLIGIGIFILLKTCNVPKSGIGIYQGKTDTMWLEVYNNQSKIPKGTIDTKADTVIRYRDNPRVDSFISFEVVKDTVYLTSLIRDSIIHWDSTYKLEYSIGFLQNYPTNPKLIFGKFTPDKITLDLHYPNIRVITQSYPVNLSEYEYYWDGDSLKAKDKRPLKIPRIKPKISFSSNAYTLMEPFQKTFKLELDGAISYDKFSFYGRTSISTHQPNFELYLGTRLTLKK